MITIRNIDRLLSCDNIFVKQVSIFTKRVLHIYYTQMLRMTILSSLCFLRVVYLPTNPPEPLIIIRRVNSTASGKESRAICTGLFGGYDIFTFAKGHGSLTVYGAIQREHCIVQYYQLPAGIIKRFSWTGARCACDGNQREEAKMKIRNGKNCCLRLEQFKNETWTRGTQEGFFFSRAIQKNKICSRRHSIPREFIYKVFSLTLSRVFCSTFA